FVTGGSAARVFRSKDRGSSWKVADTPIVHGQPPQGIFSILALDSDHLVVVGGDYKDPSNRSPGSARSEDGGRSWVLLEPTIYLSCVATIAAKTFAEQAVAVGTSGYVGLGSDRVWRGGAFHAAPAWRDPTSAGGNAVAVQASAGSRSGKVSGRVW